MPRAISVILCTHNPRLDYLGRTLDSLRKQTLPIADWDLLIIDNNSSTPVSSQADLAWHPKGRILNESTQGQIHARIRGLRETDGELVVFVDDDNVLAENYLERALQLGREHPMMGTWGGSVTAEYETPPPPTVAPYTGGLAVLKLSQAYWANVPGVMESTPFGVGMCVRRTVADAYLQRAAENPILKRLGRSGNALGAGDDTDLAWTATVLGLGYGRFPELEAVHLISSRRLTEDYMASLYAGFSASGVILSHLWPGYPGKEENFIPSLVRLGSTMLKKPRLERLIAFRSFRARRQARKLLSTI